jgi:hypothetical protein
VRQVDVLHQPEDEGEAAGDEEIEGPERDAVEHGAHKDPLAAENLLEARRPGRDHQPQQARRQQENDEGSSPDYAE